MAIAALPPLLPIEVLYSHCMVETAQTYQNAVEVNGQELVKQSELHATYRAQQEEALQQSAQAETYQGRLAFVQRLCTCIGIALGAPRGGPLFAVAGALLIAKEVSDLTGLSGRIEAAATGVHPHLGTAWKIFHTVAGPLGAIALFWQRPQLPSGPSLLKAIEGTTQAAQVITALAGGIVGFRAAQLSAAAQDLQAQWLNTQATITFIQHTIQEASAASQALQDGADFLHRPLIDWTRSSV